jgi:AraC-like DNA-binding protein
VERESVLPTGAAHVVFRVSDHPLRVFDGEGDAAGRVVGLAVVGGPRAAPYVRDVSAPTRSVGAQLQPGAVLPLLGVPADALAGQHVALDQIWGRDVDTLRGRIAEAEGSEAQLDVFEAVLAARLPRVRGVHPAVAMALERFHAGVDVGAVVHESGFSHRRFIAVFRKAVGLTPKLYCRVLRFQRALLRAADPAATWTDVALDAGYSDQPHLGRDFRELAGISPARYRALAPAHDHHVPVTPRSIPYKTRRMRSRHDRPGG